MRAPECGWFYLAMEIQNLVLVTGVLCRQLLTEILTTILAVQCAQIFEEYSTDAAVWSGYQACERGWI
jgi:hypothetical protein